jgi:hypothetical protein
MPQISLPEIKFSEIGERIQEAADESRIPEEVRERIEEAAELLVDAGKDLSEAAGRLGDEVSERLADVKWPTIALPAALAALGEVKPPKVDVAKDAKQLRKAVSKLELPEVAIGPRRSGPPILPFVVLAAVGGVFVGWWLATSSFTSARVRSAVQQVRARMGMANEWDENVGERTEDFWSNEPGWAADQAGGATLGGETASSETWPRPSGSISGEDGGLVGSSAGSAGPSGSVGSEAASEADEMNRTMGDSYPGSFGSANATGGTGYDPDTNR